MQLDQNQFCGLVVKALHTGCMQSYFDIYNISKLMFLLLSHHNQYTEPVKHKINQNIQKSLIFKLSPNLTN